MSSVSYGWKPIEPPPDPAGLAVPELTAFAELWGRQRERLQERGLLDEFTERLRRWWSIETGIIERIYDLSDGVTRVLVEHGFAAAHIPHGETQLSSEEIVAILRDHRQSLDMVMDVIGGTRELSVGWIKELHALLTRHQRTTKGQTPSGALIDLPLRHGIFKERPNNPEVADGSGTHEYCPPEHTASEMDRLVEIYHQLPAEYPEVRAAWLHHAFTQIHPFQDGNGRVARALASIDFIRAEWFPLLISRDRRDEYIQALRAADDGDLKSLVQLFVTTQERLLARAVSVAEDTVDARQSMDSILGAARSRLRARAQQDAELREAMGQRMRTLVLEVGRRFLLDTGHQVTQELAEHRISAHVMDSEPDKAHWYRSQLVAIARARGYWADMSDQRYWVRLHLKNGGVTDVVLATHFIGSVSPGAAVAVVFLDHRDADEQAGDHGPVPVANEPLTLVVDEEPAVERARFEKWLDAAIRQALALWIRYL